MLRVLVIITLLKYHSIEGLSIEYPSTAHIKERIRDDINSTDRILQYYLVRREIQFHANALEGQLEYFLKCKGSKNSIKFTIPSSADTELLLTKDDTSNTITAQLVKDQLRSELVGRYTCSETINDKYYETSVYVFIQDGTSVFTKRLYPRVLQQTGIHFFNIPCQTTSWYPQMSCPMTTDSDKCKSRKCSPKELQMNELKCNTPICDGQETCIPVNFGPSNLKASKIFFDPQIGFALENPTIPNTLSEFTCTSSYTPSRASKVPYVAFDAEYIQIHQPSLTIMPDEVVRLSCEIQYGTKLDRKVPNLFWFDDIYDLTLIANETTKASLNPKTQIYNRNSSITLRGFKRNKTYRFYCVRVSDQGIYSRSVDIICVDTPSLDLEINLSDSDTNNVLYGSNSSYDITVFTVPRSKILLEITRNGIPLTNDKRFELTSISDQNSQFHEFQLTIYNIAFEDETDIKVVAKSSALERIKIIKPYVIGDPVGQFSFVPMQIPHVIPWRDDKSDGNNNKLNLYAYGIDEDESFRVVCQVRHRADTERPLNVFIQQISCSLDDCLSNAIDKSCRSSSDQRLPLSNPHRVDSYQTQFVSNDPTSHSSPSVGNVYVCCYERDNNFIMLAKGLTALSRHPNMFNIQKPEFSLVTGDVLTYKCQAHELIYDDIRIVYNDGLYSYERNSLDSNWRLLGTNQVKQVDVDWLPTPSELIRDISIEIKTPSLKTIGKNGFVQCTGISRRSDFISHANDTYFIYVDDPVPLQFKTNLPSVVKLDRKTGDNVEFDCTHNGRPQPKVTWFKGNSPLLSDDSTLEYRNNNGSIYITRVQASETGYYTCALINGRDPTIRRSFDLRVKGSYISTKYRRLTIILSTISACFILILLVLLIIIVIKYMKMKKIVETSIFHAQRPDQPLNESQLPMAQLLRIPLPDNFASTQQIRTLISYVNGETLPNIKDDFKELGHGQFGVVYQVRLPEVGLVAAKLLPQSIRNIERHREKRKKSEDIEENQEMLGKTHELQKKKAAEMLIDEIKVMHTAGKHVNIVSLLKVAYPEAKFKYLITGGVIRDEDSFYLMELCSNGSLESVLKRFLRPSSDASANKLSLYETLGKQRERGMTVTEALELCELTVDDLKLVAYQVACGIDYLNRKQIIHCDIAARNVLVSSRFIMKICDFGLATWTTYKSYREQLARQESVQLEKKNNELATHNLTPELARAFLRASTSEERLLLNKSTIKSDVWSFGIFLWTLFLKCRIRPFSKLSEEVKNDSMGETFFHRLARVVSEGRVLRYIDYHPEIPRDIYGIIRECLVDESSRRDMTHIRGLLCHSKMLSERAFEYYRSEYNRYQEENARDGTVLIFGENQGVSDLPSFDGENEHDDNHTSNEVVFRSQEKSEYYPSAIDQTAKMQPKKSYGQQNEADSYLEPVAPNNDNRFEDMTPLVNKNVKETNKKSSENESNIPRTGIKPRAPIRPPRPFPPVKRDDQGDSYV